MEFVLILEPEVKAERLELGKAKEETLDFIQKWVYDGVCQSFYSVPAIAIVHGEPGKEIPLSLLVFSVTGLHPLPNQWRTNKKV